MKNPKIVKIEKILGAPPDGIWKDDDQKLLDLLTKPKTKVVAPPPPDVLTPGDSVDPMAGAAPATYN